MFFPPTAVAVISMIDVSVVPGYCTGCCGYCHWYLFLLSREQELQNYGIFQKHGASGKWCYLYRCCVELIDHPWFFFFFLNSSLSIAPLHIRLQTKPVGYRISQHTCSNSKNQQTPYRINSSISNISFINNCTCYKAGRCHLSKHKVQTKMKTGNAIQTITR